MNLKKVLPEPSAIVREAIIVIGGLALAAFVISRIPQLQRFIQNQSITLKDQRGEVLF